MSLSLSLSFCWSGHVPSSLWSDLKSHKSLRVLYGSVFHNDHESTSCNGTYSAFWGQLKTPSQLDVLEWDGCDGSQFNTPNSNQFAILSVSIFYKISLSISISIFSKISLSISIFFKFADISTNVINIWHSFNKSGEKNTEIGWKQAKKFGILHPFCVIISSTFLWSPDWYQYFPKSPYQ